MSERLIILGAGESGIGAAILGKQQGFDVLVSEFGGLNPETRAFFDSESIGYEENGHTDSVLDAHLVVKSPGIPDHVPIILQLIAKGITVISEIEFAYRFISQSKIIAITGTNGKTTTSLLTHHILESAGYKVALGGNVGVSLARLVAQGGYDYYVVEVSSFQLDGIVSFKPAVAVLLNITPDHLDRYNDSFDQYVKSKFRIIENITKEECFIYYSDDVSISQELAKYQIESCLFAISASNSKGKSAFLGKEHLIFNYQFEEKKKHFTVPTAEISLIGKHNMINTMAAVLSALHFDVPLEKILKGLKTFKNTAHRLEKVATINEVTYINDSKATNVDAVYYALDGVKAPIIWIAGGVDKGNDYSLIESLVTKNVKHLICIGTDNEALLSAFKGKVEISEAQSMSEAIASGTRNANSGDVVLLSPACASFDRFKNYKERGDSFKKEVEELGNKQKIEV